MRDRYLRWRNRLTSEVVVLGGQHWRVTKQRGKIVGIESWKSVPGAEPRAWQHSIWKGEIR